MPEIASAAEVPIIAAMSGSVFLLVETTVQTTCTSFMKPSGKSGRIGRSIRREIRVSFSEGRPLRLKEPHGIFPGGDVCSWYWNTTMEERRVGKECVIAC